MDQLFNVLLVALRVICFFIDKVVYSLIPVLYKLLLYLARVDLVSDNVPVKALIQRIYILIGIFMLFRLSFSIMSYIVNPDAFSDQSKGFTNLVRRVMVAVVLLACIPWLFSKAYEIQGKILTSGILPRLVLGDAGSYNSKSNKSLEKSIETSAKDIQFLMFSPFFSLNYDNKDLTNCDPSNSKHSTSHLLGTNGMALSDKCLEDVERFFREDTQLSSSGVSLEDFFRTADSTNSDPVDKRKFKSFGSLVSWTLSDGEFAINYNPIISTLCGGYLVFLLLSFCIDVAARVIRLMFLQILSPIAVISSIDPTTSGDRLKEWAKECLKVWASLFLRLLVVFLIIQLVRVITDTIYSESFKVAGLSNGKGTNVVIFVFLVLGVFQAAKSIPDLIEKATGIKMSGELQLNPFKNSAVAGMTGMGLGAVVGGFAGLRAGVEAGAPVRGVLGGVATGIGKGREEKLGVGVVGSIRRKTYKDMTGSDLRTFNPWQKLYGYGGSKKVEAEKEYRNRGYEQINDLDTELNMVSHQNANNYSILKSNGIDVSTGTGVDGTTYEQRKTNREQNEQRMNSIKSDISQQRVILSRAQAERDSRQSRVSDIKKQMENIQTQLNDKNRILMSDGSNSDETLRRMQSALSRDYESSKEELNSANSNVKQIEEEISLKQSNLDRVTSAYDSDDNIIKAYEEYVQGIIREKELRGERSKIEKDIETINDQISDMKTFYHVDESTRQSVAEAKKHIDDRG